MNRPKILIVDDNIHILHAFESLLEKEGCVSFLAETAHQALELLYHKRPGSVFLDLSLPDAYGLDLIKKIKTVNPSITVVVIMDDESADLKKKAIKLGAFACLDKPLSISNIREVLNDIMQ